MRAVVDDGPKDVSVNEVPDAAIEAPADAVVTTSATNICGSDLHIYQAGAADWRLARSSGTKPLRGRSVGVKVDDRMCLPFNIGSATPALAVSTPLNVRVGLGYPSVRLSAPASQDRLQSRGVRLRSRAITANIITEQCWGSSRLACRFRGRFRRCASVPSRAGCAVHRARSRPPGPPPSRQGI